MTAQPVASLSFSDAQKACEHLIDNIYEFVDSINSVFPGKGLWGFVITFGRYENKDTDLKRSFSQQRCL